MFPTARRVALVAAIMSGVLVAGAQGRRGADDAPLQFQLATLLFDDTRFEEALEAFHNAAQSDDPRIALLARMGMVRSALRIGDFDRAQHEASSLRDEAPRDPEAIAVHADALWAAGLFDEAERAYLSRRRGSLAG